MAETAYIQYPFKVGDRVELEDMNAGAGETRWTDIIHSVLLDNHEHMTVVETCCGMRRFATYARPREEPTNCVTCLAEMP